MAISKSSNETAVENWRSKLCIQACEKESSRFSYTSSALCHKNNCRMICMAPLLKAQTKCNRVVIKAAQSKDANSIKNGWVTQMTKYIVHMSIAKAVP
jgi:hypothetical protein